MVGTNTDEFSIDSNPEADEDVEVIVIADRSFSIGKETFELAKCAIDVSKC